MKIGRVGSVLIAAAVALVVFSLAPARVDSKNVDPCTREIPAHKAELFCGESQVNTDITWAWVLGNKKQADAYSQKSYYVHRLDIVLAVGAAVGFGALTYVFIQSRQKTVLATAFALGLMILVYSPARVTRYDWSKVNCGQASGTGGASFGRCPGQMEEYVQWGWLRDTRIINGGTSDFPVQYKVQASDVALDVAAAALVGWLAYVAISRRNQRGLYGRTT